MCPIELLSQMIPSGALLVVYDIIVIGNTLKLIGFSYFWMHFSYPGCALLISTEGLWLDDVRTLCHSDSELRQSLLSLLCDWMWPKCVRRVLGTVW